MLSHLKEMVGSERLAGRRVHLIRHASPEIDPGLPAVEWGLSPKGRRDARALAVRMGLSATRIWSSGEPKARETAAILAEDAGVAAAVHADLGEVAFRAGFLAQAEFARRVARYLEGSADPGFEPYSEAQRRIMGCVAELCLAEEGDLALVSHGRIITVLLSEILGRRLGAAEWSRIGMPDWTLLDIERGVALAGFAVDF